MSEAADIVLTEDPPPEARDAIGAVLRRYNEDYIPGDDPTRSSFALLVKSPGSEKVLGGLLARTWREMLSVELVALPPELRGSGLGSRLLGLAEEEARRRGCRNAWLQTAAWQARGFYEKLGYRLFGQLDDYPAGHPRYFLTKRL